MEGAMTKTNSLEERIVAALGNPNNGSDALIELIEEVETAATTADQVAIDERTKSLDLVHDPHQARDRIAAAELTRDRLKTQLPKLRDKLAGALRSEEHERWLSDFSRVRQQRDDAVSLFRDYQQHAEAIAHMFALAEQVDKEVSRINGSAPDGEHRRLRSVELEARNLEHFTRDNPSLASTVELRAWDNSGKTLWPLTSSGSFAAAFASSMTAPAYSPADWSKPEYQAQRRAEKEKNNREIGKNYQRMTEQQEDRINAEERERFAASRRPT
jgi:hypothetical protein